jgi:intergrase/recombinase
MLGRSSSLVRTLALRAINGHTTNLNLEDFNKYVKNKYAESYQNTIMCYVKRYYQFIDNPKALEQLPYTIRNNCIKSLIILSKYLGIYTEFIDSLKKYGIKTTTQDSFNSFLRIFNVSSNGNNILEWYGTAISNLRDNEKTLLKFLLYSGIRKEEAIMSFNKIIELHRLNRLDEYYNKQLSCLMHFKYPKEFIRKTKNCFITFINIDLVNEIANSETVSYQAIIKRLHRKNIKCRINELRDYYGTYLLQHGILEQEVNLCQGRIPPSIFVKHYWSPKLSELRDRIFKALSEIE